jgi:hypothetical protein
MKIRRAAVLVATATVTFVAPVGAFVPSASAAQMSASTAQTDAGPILEVGPCPPGQVGFWAYVSATPNVYYWFCF